MYSARRAKGVLRAAARRKPAEFAAVQPKIEKFAASVDALQLAAEAVQQAAEHLLNAWPRDSVEGEQEARDLTYLVQRLVDKTDAKRKLEPAWADFESCDGWVLEEHARRLHGYRRRFDGPTTTATSEKSSGRSSSGSSVPNKKFNGALSELMKPSSRVESDGDAVALLEALAYVAQHSVPMPNWLALELIPRLKRVMTEPVTLSAAFGIEAALPADGKKSLTKRLDRDKAALIASLACMNGASASEALAEIFKLTGVKPSAAVKKLVELLLFGNTKPSSTKHKMR